MSAEWRVQDPPPKHTHSRTPPHPHPLTLAPRYLEDFTPRLGESRSTSTRGAISVHINSNEHTDSRMAQNWIDFDAGW